MSPQPPLTRSEVRGLLAHYRLAGGDQVPDGMVTAWLRDLRGYSAGECHAALSSLPPNRVTRTTAVEITRLVDHARSHPATTGTPSSARPPAPRDQAAEQAAGAAAGARGIRDVYEAMGWTWNPEHVLARSVRCPFCRALAGQVCGPLTRNRNGKRELRDPITRMHPSRLEAARAKQKQAAEDHTTRGPAASAAVPQGAHA
ncbi:hypothetical protein FKR81_32365 [Lentzea tibetensis]|uniref:DNA-binding phage zinc finger domain-containing protein n=1 Tax=Lentzea tibetensis TaxID=2591470 RepID=A0A563EKZ9_9PSEU|nr:hypothetical protein [Lentzea tibetensis]TWP47410.1 hypothetical protein FKR81_32365 [Lentzea tibetensis]